MISHVNECSLAEALLLSASGDVWKPAMLDATTQCEAYTGTYPFPVPHRSSLMSVRPRSSSMLSPTSPKTNASDIACSLARVDMFKVVSTVKCSLRQLTNFLSKPTNMRHHEADLRTCEVIAEETDALWVHATYERNPPVDVVAAHRRATYKLPEDMNRNEALSEFVANVILPANGVRPSPTMSASGSLRKRGTASLDLPPEVFVYAIRSAPHHEVPPSPAYMRVRIHLSAFVAYETPGPCVQLTFVHSFDEHSTTTLAWCMKKVVCIRHHCEPGRPRAKKRIMAPVEARQCERLHTEANCRLLGGSDRASTDSQMRASTVDSYSPTEAVQSRIHVFESFFTLHTAGAWKLVLEQEGCTVEECQVSMCLPTLPHLMAYRVTTNIGCSLDTFYRFAGDPLQLHNFDALTESTKIVDVRSDGIVVYAQYKPLSTTSPKRDICVLTSTALLRAEEAHQRKLLLSTDETDVVYVQNSIQSNHFPHCYGYERQVVYAFGFIAVPTTAGDKEGQVLCSLRVHHIVCMDSSEAQQPRLEVAMIQQHSTRLAWIRQICEDMRRTNVPSVAQRPTTPFSLTKQGKSLTRAFKMVATLEDVSRNETPYLSVIHSAVEELETSEDLQSIFSRGESQYSLIGDNLSTTQAEPPQQLRVDNCNEVDAVYGTKVTLPGARHQDLLERFEALQQQRELLNDSSGRLRRRELEKLHNKCATVEKKKRNPENPGMCSIEAVGRDNLEEEGREEGKIDGKGQGDDALRDDDAKEEEVEEDEEEELADGDKDEEAGSEEVEEDEEEELADGDEEGNEEVEEGEGEELEDDEEDEEGSEEVEEGEGEELDDGEEDEEGSEEVEEGEGLDDGDEDEEGSEEEGEDEELDDHDEEDEEGSEEVEEGDELYEEVLEELEEEEEEENEPKENVINAREECDVGEHLANESNDEAGHGEGMERYCEQPVVEKPCDKIGGNEKLNEKMSGSLVASGGLDGEDREWFNCEEREGMLAAEAEVLQPDGRHSRSEDEGRVERKQGDETRGSSRRSDARVENGDGDESSGMCAERAENVGSWFDSGHRDWEKTMSPTGIYPLEHEPNGSASAFALHVCVRECRNLTVRHRGKHTVFFHIRTTSSNAQTSEVPLTAAPIFPREVVTLNGTRVDGVCFTALVKTADGDVRRFGKALVSLNHLRLSEWWTRWIPLVHKAGTSSAYECGSVSVSLRLCKVSDSVDASVLWTEEQLDKETETSFTNIDERESEIRERVRAVIGMDGNEYLHLQEWLVGRCYHKSFADIEVYLGRYKKGEKIVVTVTDVYDLLSELGLPLLNSSSCHVWLESCGTGHRTRSVMLRNQLAVFNESFQLNCGLYDGVRIVVFAGGVSVGEVVVSASRHEGICTFMLVSSPGCDTAQPCGKITVEIHRRIMFDPQKNCSSTTRGNTANYRLYGTMLTRNDLDGELTKNLRLSLWAYCRQSLHTLDVIASSAYEAKRYLKKLGSPPECYEVRVSLKHWRQKSSRWDSSQATHSTDTTMHLTGGRNKAPRGASSKPREVYAIIHSGLNHHRTNPFRVDASGAAQFNHPVVLSDVVPERDEVLVNVIGKGFPGTDEMDLGVVVFPFRDLKIREAKRLTVPLVRNAATSHAHFEGVLQLEILAVNFTSKSLCSVDAELRRSHLRKMLYHYAPHQLHRVECFLADSAQGDAQVLNALGAVRGRVEIERAPMDVCVVSLIDFVHSSAVYVRVYLNGTSILCTGKVSGYGTVAFNKKKNKAATTVMLDDAQHAKMRFEVMESRYMSSKVICTAHMSLRNLVASHENTCVLHLFDSHFNEAGRLHVTLKSSAFVKSDVVHSVTDNVDRDVISLLRRYKPEALPFVHPLIAEASCRETAHAELRSRLVPRSTAITVFVSIDLLSVYDVSSVFRPRPKLYKQKALEPYGEREYVVSIHCDGDEASIVCPTDSAEKHGRPIRLDIPHTSEPVRHDLVIVVRRPFTSRSSRALVNGNRKPVSKKEQPAPSCCSAVHDNSVQTIQCMEDTEDVGIAVLSLRALLTPELYDVAESITVPLLYLQGGGTGVVSLLNQQRQCSSGNPPNCEVIGNIAISIRLPTYEQPPRWLRFNTADMEAQGPIDREFIRYHEQAIRNLLTEYEPVSLLDMHYALYEENVNEGCWRHSLVQWRSKLHERFAVEDSKCDQPPSLTTIRSSNAISKKNDVSALTAKSEGWKI